MLSKEKLGEIGAFQGKPYLSYHDRQTGQTFYLREYRAINSIINGTYKFDLYVTKLNLLEVKETEPTVSSETEPTVSSVSELIDPVKHAENLRETPPSEKTIHRIPLSLSFSLSNDNHSESEQPKEEEIKNKFINTKQPSVSLSIIDELVERWKSITECDLSSPLRTQTVKNLTYAYEDIFSSSLKNWEDYCNLIASSKYLMGETKQEFKLNLGWASKPDSIEKIMTGYFTTGDRKAKPKPLNAQPITDADPLVALFKKSCLEANKALYIAWIQPLKISSPSEGVIVCMAPIRFISTYLWENDPFRFGFMIKKLGIKKIVLKDSEGKVIGKIVPRNAN